VPTRPTRRPSAGIFAAKGRPADHPLIVHLAAGGELDRWARDIPSPAWELAEAFWPGPLTLILKRAAAVPTAVTGGQDSVGLRVPAHPLALRLLRAYAEAGGGLGGLSAASPHRRPTASAASARPKPPTSATSSATQVRLILDGGRLPGRHRVDDSRPDARRRRADRACCARDGSRPEQIATVIGILPQIGTPGARLRWPRTMRQTTPLRLLPLDRAWAKSSTSCAAAIKRCAAAVPSQCHGRAGIGRHRDACRSPAAGSIPRGYARALYAALARSSIKRQPN
jgi:L-threonylcarbamoyladenylate synthase